MQENCLTGLFPLPRLWNRLFLFSPNQVRLKAEQGVWCERPSGVWSLPRLASRLRSATAWARLPTRPSALLELERKGRDGSAVHPLPAQSLTSLRFCQPLALLLSLLHQTLSSLSLGEMVGVSKYQTEYAQTQSMPKGPRTSIGMC